MAVVGIGNVGLPFAAIASRCHEVVGIDINEEWVKKLVSHVPLTEPNLNEYLRKYPFPKTTDLSHVSGKDVIFIVVGSQKEEYSVSLILSALEMVIPYLKNSNMILVIMSTIKPGSMREHIFPLLNREKVLQKIKGVCYNPVFVALGSAIEYFNNPGFVVIGESSPEAGDGLESFYRDIYADSVKFHRSSIENIEVLKFALNLALINKISLLNTLTEFCENYGAHIDFVTEVLKEDPRIAGKKMFKGGLGFGGPCFPVDARSFRKSQMEKNLDTSLIDAIINVNERQVDRTVQLIERMNDNKISVLGVTYKPNVALTTESQALQIINRLSKIKDVMIYDPRGMENAGEELGETVRYAGTLKEALDFGEIILITVEWPHFFSISNDDLRRDQTVIDPWRLLENKDLRVKYMPFGAKQK